MRAEDWVPLYTMEAAPFGGDRAVCRICQGYVGAEEEHQRSHVDFHKTSHTAFVGKKWWWRRGRG